MSDPQLWELIGSHWRIPIVVRWHDVIAEIQLPDMPMLSRQKEAACDFLRTSGGQEREGAFYLQKSAIIKIAIASTSRDPEEILQWSPAPPRITEARDDMHNSLWNPCEFVDGYVKSSFAVIHDKLVVDAVFISFCKFMLHRLLNEGKPVDLLFAKITPLMMRRNWLAVIAYADKRGPKMGRFSTKMESIVRRLAEYMCSSGVLAWDEENKVATWTLDILPSSHFKRMATNLELEKKRKRYVAASYWIYMIEQLKRQLPHALKSYQSYLEEASVPFPVIPAKHRVGVKTTRRPSNKWDAKRPVGTIRGGHHYPRPWDTPINLSSDPQRFPQGVQNPLEETDEELS